MAPSWELQGSVTDKDKSFVEEWENVAPGVNYVIRENRRGDQEYVEVKGDGRKFKLTTYDRMLTEDSIVDHHHNPFRNGAFRPLTVPEDVSIDTNPNAMSNEDIKNLFKASDTAWDEWMDLIDSHSTIQRMIDMANNGEEDLTVKRLRQLESIHAQLTGYDGNRKRALAYKDPELDKASRMAANESGSKVEPPSATPPAPRRGRPPKAAANA